MKGCIIALAILALIIGAAAVNEKLIQHASESLLDDLSTLPEKPEPTQTPAAVASVRKEFEGRLPYLRITVPRSALDRITEALLLLEAHAQASPSDYIATKALLRKLAQDMAEPWKTASEKLLSLPKLAPVSLEKLKIQPHVR